MEININVNSNRETTRRGSYLSFANSDNNSFFLVEFAHKILKEEQKTKNPLKIPHRAPNFKPVKEKQIKQKRKRERKDTKISALTHVTQKIALVKPSVQSCPNL